MDLKFAIFLVIGFFVLGFLIAIGAPAVMQLNAMAPDDEDARIQELLSECNTKILIYQNMMSEESRKNFCCANNDLNNNGVIDDGEWCATACTSCSVEGMSVIMICRNPVDYYTTHNNC